MMQPGEAEKIQMRREAKAAKDGALAFLRKADELMEKKQGSNIPGVLYSMSGYENAAIDAIRDIENVEVRLFIKGVGIATCVRIAIQHCLDRLGMESMTMERYALSISIAKQIVRHRQMIAFHLNNPGLAKRLEHRAKDERMSKDKAFRVMERMQKRIGYCAEQLGDNARWQLGTIMYQALLGVGMLEQEPSERTEGKWNARLSEDALRLLNAKLESIALATPSRTPMVCPPKPWQPHGGGGYYTEMAQNTFRISTEPGPDIRKTIRALIGEDALKAINQMQATPLRICRPVLDALIEINRKGLLPALSADGMLPAEPAKPAALLIPPAERTTEQKYQVDTWKLERRDWESRRFRDMAFRARAARVLYMATGVKDAEAIYQPWHFDLTGRMYPAHAGMATMGADIQQGVLEFARGEPLDTPEAVTFWKRNIAACYGYDKEKNEKMDAWADEHSAMLIRIAEDPLGTLDEWAGADGPTQFLRACFEWAAWKKNPEGFLSHLPVHMDGKCNGIQHLAAMSRSQELAEMVNITAGDNLNDLYRVTAEETIKRINDPSREEPAAPLAKVAAQKGTIDRALCKHTAMTLAYGAKLVSTLDNVRNKLSRNRPDWLDLRDVNDAAVAIGKEIWGAASHVMKDAFRTMRVMTEVAHMIKRDMSNGEIFTCMMPDGFPVTIRNRESGYLPPAAVAHELQGASRKPSTSEFTVCFGPHLIHAYDACHMRMTVNAAAAEGITDTWMIHDSFGCHARFAPRLGQIVREQFARLHAGYRPFEILVNDYHGVLDEPYVFGSYNPKDVIHSVYSFR